MSTGDINLSGKGLSGPKGGPFSPVSIRTREANLSFHLMAAAEILRRFGPSTVCLNLAVNPELGFEGLQALVQGMKRGRQSKWQLKALFLIGCGLGGRGTCLFRCLEPLALILISPLRTDSKASANQLIELI